MYYVYALYSRGFDKIYIGATSDINRRLISHNHPENKRWTGKFKPWIIVYTEECLTKSSALIREKELKSYRGREFIKSLIPT